MIGVAVQPSEEEAAREFFELWKTPWEFCRDAGHYDVIVCTAKATRSAAAPLILIFGGAPTECDQENRLTVRSRSGGTTLSCAGSRLPIYGATATFPTGPAGLVTDEASREPVIHARRANGTTVVRVGYDLFAETSFLLTTGQPPTNAGMPAMELHIALARDLITRAGLPLVEIPPAPAGHPFIACLTHDIDHPRLRSHVFDHTMFGFLHRATVGSLVAFGRNRIPAGRLWANLAAAARLPFVYLGWARDFWRDFDRYLALEAGRPSTFFVMAVRGDPGRTAEGAGPARRAAAYDLADVAPQLQRITAAGGEVGLHGLDAWIDEDAGVAERNRVAQALGTAALGVRMHWLYFDGTSPARLDHAGFSYDSTVGYNETVGYRAGTTQAYRPPGTATLLELPLHVMDTALFYPSHLNLREDDARRRVGGMMDDAARFGGALTVNWHDRSIAPERLWGEFYASLLDELSCRKAWFATAAQAVAWFRKRRRATVEAGRSDGDRIDVRAQVAEPDNLPDLRVRIFKPCLRRMDECLAVGQPAAYTDVPLGNRIETQISV
jgi:hypothetical protein